MEQRETIFVSVCAIYIFMNIFKHLLGALSKPGTVRHMSHFSGNEIVSLYFIT